MTTRSGPGDGPAPGLDAIMSERRQLINLAYRLLCSLAELLGSIFLLAAAVTGLRATNTRGGRSRLRSMRSPTLRSQLHERRPFGSPAATSARPRGSFASRWTTAHLPNRGQRARPAACL